MLGQHPIFVAGMPRAGSMWTYNVVRSLILLGGQRPVPDKVPPDEKQVIQEALSKPAGQGGVYCIKTHYAIPVDRNDIKIICNIRDIRDATLSFMRFMRCPFAVALDSARESMKITDYYLGSGRLTVLPVDYDDVVGASSSVVARIADFIGVQPTRKEIESIVAQHSRERMAERLRKMNAVTLGASGEIQNQPDSGAYTTIRNMDGSYRVYDYETGFQSNHITSSRAGEWRQVFSDEQQRLLNELLGDWLQRYGFDV